MGQWIARILGWLLFVLMYHDKVDMPPLFSSPHVHMQKTFYPRAGLAIMFESMNKPKSLSTWNFEHCSSLQGHRLVIGLYLLYFFLKITYLVTQSSTFHHWSGGLVKSWARRAVAFANSLLWWLCCEWWYRHGATVETWWFERVGHQWFISIYSNHDH